MKSEQKYWEELLRVHRQVKVLRSLRRKTGYNLKKISDLTGYSIKYLFNVQEQLIKPNPDLIEKLEQLNG
jgi:predicted transcriptional regulator